MSEIIWKKVLLFVLAILVMFALVQYRSANDYDKDFANIDLKQGKTIHHVLDIGKQGELKYLVQPNIYTAYFRLRTGEKSADLSCAAEGMTMFLSQSSKKGIWTELKPRQILRAHKGTISLNAELYAPRENVKRYQVTQGKIKFYKGGKEYATLVVDVVNSRYK